jgi:DNA ligase (NAD+)
VGETVARKLAESFGSLDSLMKADREALEQVDEIGERIADSVIEYFGDASNLQLIERLKNAGLNMEMEDTRKEGSTMLAGKTFVISGVFSQNSREELKELILRHGGKNSGSISAKTDYILAGENMGPSKYRKAQELGIPLISEEQFLSMITPSHSI